MGTKTKVIITVLNCKKNTVRRECILNTWAKNLPSDVELFFLIGDEGNPSRIEGNILYLDCPDDYVSLPHKQVDALRYLYDRDFTHVFCCDDDTYVVVDRLLDCGYENHDYTGARTYTPDHKRIEHAYGGSGFFLSRKAVDKLLPLSRNHPLFKVTQPWADTLIGVAMHINNIPFVADKRFDKGKYIDGEKATIYDPVDNKHIFMGSGKTTVLPTKKNGVITSHFIQEDVFGQIYNHLEGDGEIDNKYLIKSEYDGRIVVIREIEGSWYYEYEGSEEICGPFDYAEDAELGAVANRLELGAC